MATNYKNFFCELGKKITEERIKRGYTIEEFSKKAKIRKQYLKKIEEGSAIGMNISHYALICNVLDFELYELVEGIEY